MMALVALFATSCEQAGDEKGGNGGSTSLFDVKIEVDGNVADITVWPANYDMYYAWDVFPKADIDAEFDGDINAVAEYYLEYLEYLASQYAAYGYSFTDFLYQGKDSYSYPLDSNTEYVFFAFGVDVDKVKVNTAVETKTFVTGEAAPVNMTATECYVDRYPADEELPFDLYYIEMYEGNQIAMLLLIEEANSANCAGTHTALTGDTIQAGTFNPGETSGNSIYPSFWGEIDASTGYLSSYGLLADGTVKVTINGDNYVVDADLTDTNGVAYAIDYSGEVAYTDNTTSSVKASKANFRQLSIAARMHRAGKISIRK